MYLFRIAFGEPPSPEGKAYFPGGDPHGYDHQEDNYYGKETVCYKNDYHGEEASYYGKEIICHAKDRYRGQEAFHHSKKALHSYAEDFDNQENHGDKTDPGASEEAPAYAVGAPGMEAYQEEA